jgi:LysR family transcriptional regulator, nitrogen assimilation regulatory protein
LRLRQLRSFVRVCQLGSITRAAVELHIAQPALGLQIRNLEEIFGAPLVVRSARGVSPTPEGELVLALAHEVLDRTHAVKKQIEEMAGRFPRILTVGLTPSLISLVAGVLAETAHTQLPKLSLRFVESFSTQIAASVHDQQIDIGLCFDPPAEFLSHCTPILSELLCYVSAPRDDVGPITLEEALHQPLALPDESDQIRKKVEAAARTLDLPVICKYELRSVQAAKDLAIRGLAGAIVPFASMMQSFRSSEVSVRLIVSPTIERTLYLMRRSDRIPSSIEEQLVEIIQNTIKVVVKEGQYLGCYTLTAGAPA